MKSKIKEKISDYFKDKKPYTKKELQEYMKPTKEKQNRLEKLLRSRKNWTTAARCCQLLGLRTGEAGKRLVRSMAEHSEGKVIGGQEGYKHVKNASLVDVINSTMILESQAHKMTNRIKQIEKAWGNV